ncbi:putative fungal-specific transcription factor [Tricladium varicosporioides]|nr:putative fungal-specific transcription factor [Hymenoscyphus varicosporioides]
METPSSRSSLEPVRQVCTSCKARKRKCDKAIPKCSSCTKKNLTCEYLTPEQTRNTVSVSNGLWCSLQGEDEGAGIQVIDLATILFLDPSLLRYGQVEAPQMVPPVPTQILRLLGDMDEIHTTTSTFFDHIHLWMPFISKKRFYERHLRPSCQLQPDIVLLLLCLKLATTLPPTDPRNPQTPLYHIVKHFYLEIEGSGILSIQVLQAGVLLALYELGHAIYPAAYLSIGACARYAHALGIGVSGNLNTRRVLTMVEVEERRRVWWAIVILDRFVSIGSPGRPFATADPKLDDFLPTDDALWDQGIVRSDESFTLSSPMTGHMSSFALLCQAARLLGQVLYYVSGDSAIHDDVWMQLDRTLQSMLTASLEVETPDTDQITFIYSALTALYTPWISPASIKTVEDGRSLRARAVMQQISETIASNLVVKQCFSGRNLEDMSPWGVYMAYRVCVFHISSGQEDPASLEVLNGLKEGFRAIDVRWNAAGVYLQLLEAREVMGIL